MQLRKELTGELWIKKYLMVLYEIHHSQRLQLWEQGNFLHLLPLYFLWFNLLHSDPTHSGKINYIFENPT